MNRVFVFYKQSILRKLFGCNIQVSNFRLEICYTYESASWELFSSRKHFSRGSGNGTKILRYYGGSPDE